MVFFQIKDDVWGLRPVTLLKKVKTQLKMLKLRPYRRWTQIKERFRQKQPLEVFCKKGALKISQFSQENTYIGVSF